jgi:toxin CcdB
MIRQFDVFPNPSKRGRQERPFVVVVQSNFLNATSGRVSVPLIAENEMKPDGRLNPLFRIDGQRVYFHPAEITTIPVTFLRNAIANLEAERYRIVAALDLVFTGI